MFQKDSGNGCVERRREATEKIDNLDDFRDFFTPGEKNRSELHGGLAYCHFSEGEQMSSILKKLKVTLRCVPLDGTPEEGKCLFTGNASPPVPPPSRVPPGAG